MEQKGKTMDKTIQQINREKALKAKKSTLLKEMQPLIDFFTGVYGECTPKIIVSRKLVIEHDRFTKTVIPLRLARELIKKL